MKKTEPLPKSVLASAEAESSNELFAIKSPLFVLYCRKSYTENLTHDFCAGKIFRSLLTRLGDLEQTIHARRRDDFYGTKL